MLVQDVANQKRLKADRLASESGSRAILDQLSLSIWEEDWSAVKQMIDRLAKRGVRDWRRYFRKHPDQLRKAANLVEIIDLNRVTDGIDRAPGKEAVIKADRGHSPTARGLDAFFEQLVVFAEGDTRFVTDVTERVSDETEVITRIWAAVPSEQQTTWSRIFTTVEDITGRKRAEEALLESEGRFRRLVESVNVIPWEIDPATWRFTYVGPQVERIFGYPIEQWFGDNFLHDHIHPDDREAAFSLCLEATARGEDHELEYRMLASDGRVIWVRDIASVVTDEDGPIKVRGFLFDITDRKEAEQRIEHLAYYDQLTGLPNRALFVDRLGQAITAAERGDRSLVVLSLGLDRFSAITDTLGHAAGDEVVKEVAGRLGRCLRDGDTVARATGDTFLILLTALRKAEHATKVLQQIFTALEAPVTYGDRELHVTASIGASVFPADGANGEALLKNADSALHRAKSEAPGGYRFFTADMNAKALARLSLETRLRRAVETDELVVHYQPQVDLQNGRLIGVEALVRWQPPDQELVPPAEFIALAEETGLIVPLGERVLDIACAQARAWREAGLPALDMAVNVSARQLHDDRLIATVERILADAELSPDRLKLELTESALMGDPEKTARTMAAFREMGIRLAVDDFGTGYSSLSYLSRFPIETLKIDRSFIITMTTDRNNAAIVEAIMSLAHSLEMKVIAEGVDADEQLTYLRAYRCDAIQGYIFSPPVPTDEIPRLVEKGFRAQTSGP